MDQFHPFLVRMRIAALQSEILSKNRPASGFVRSRRSKVTVVKDPSGEWKLGKTRVVRARSGSASSAS
ncbi:hypothetical protein E4U52_006359 [Claviceps spartinae]|nr:hypothetical protein E4U52_006359 [Claviceps spartinae]KAG6077619.1 hypothetical protein E4U15_004605 [Claviceps sp. LM218 group G6]KAG6091998.1 hypothetical protein E4U30_006046 [Claviceps sp. LM220 group G6]KAG6095515.1 hypothetical protein E4U31_005774 [Claviceps sp. LM219 group G6]KAG6120386.1 hypothetical protein E4U14_003651 [Claviceps sp. LM454 group G7]